MHNLAIITARGGSKRIPRKNIKNFLGQPIMAYSINAAIESQIFDEVMVSTDDQEIAEIAIKYGAKVPFFRSSQNSDDHATTSDVLDEVLKKYAEQKLNFDFACCIYPTAPFVSSDILKLSLDLLCEKKFDTVLPVCEFSFPILRSFKADQEGLVSYAFPEFKNIRSQDLPKYFHDAGQFYFFNVNQYLQSGILITNNSYGIVRSELEVQDIDQGVDWSLAEIKYQLWKNPNL